MANPESVAQFYLDSFGNGRIGYVQSTALNTTGNAVITIPLLVGGLTNAGALAGSGSVIPRRVTVMGSNGNIALANVSITTSNDGNLSNVVVGNTVLTAVSTAGKYQDLTITYTANTAITGFTTQALYVNVVTASGNTNTASIAVYGDVVTF